MSTKDKWIRRFSVDETAKHKNGFTIYKITSVLFPLDSPEAVTVVSVWKRFSDVQRLHASMKTLHAGLHLRGTFPVLPKNRYFNRFTPKVIEERAKSIKTLLEFLSEYRLLFTSTDFVNFLQTGYPEPTPKGGVINAIRSSLHLPIEEIPPLEYQTSDEDARSPTHSLRTETDSVALDISRIPIYEAALVERVAIANVAPIDAVARPVDVVDSRVDSVASIASSYDSSADSEFFEELSKISVNNVKCVKNLPDLINFDVPIVAFDDYHTMGYVSKGNTSKIDYGMDEASSSVVRTGCNQEPGFSSSLSSPVRVKETKGSVLTEFDRRDISLSPSMSLRAKETEDSVTDYDLTPSPSSVIRVNEMENSYVFESPLYDVCERDNDSDRTACESGTDNISQCASSYSIPSLSYTGRTRETADGFVSNSNCPSSYSTPSLSRTGHSIETVDGLMSQSETDSVSQFASSHTPSHSQVGRAQETEDYVFEAGYLLAMAARCEDRSQYRRAFHYYRAGIEKMLIGVRSDTDTQRRAIIKQKINKYLSYAETIYKNHLCNADDNLLSEPEEAESLALCPPPISMLRRPYEDLSSYRVLGILGPSVMLVLHRTEQTCYAMKVIRKIPNNLTEFDEYFMQRTNETRQPVLPTLIPYMVPLHAYIETNSLIFLILSYAPGKKLFDYIKDYAKSLPATPNREVNLENVFTEPSKRSIDVVNDNCDVTETDNVNKQDLNENHSKSDVERLDNDDVSINELVVNSKKLLRNVDLALTEIPNVGAVQDDSDEKRVNLRRDVEKTINTSLINKALPRSAVRCWAAQLLAAIDGLHNCGVICRDLSPRNILLGEKGQIILTYFVFYPGLDMALRAKPKDLDSLMYLAPELHREVFLDPERDVSLERVCDFWSFGAILYELLCGVPLPSLHRGIFNSHTLLQLPDGLPLEVQSILTQLLTYEPSQRLGAGREGIEEIKQHPYFRGVDWQQIYNGWSVPR